MSSPREYGDAHARRGGDDSVPRSGDNQVLSPEEGRSGTGWHSTTVEVVEEDPRWYEPEGSSGRLGDSSKGPELSDRARLGVTPEESLLRTIQGQERPSLETPGGRRTLDNWLMQIALDPPDTETKEPVRALLETVSASQSARPSIVTPRLPYGDGSVTERYAGEVRQEPRSRATVVEDYVAGKTNYFGTSPRAPTSVEREDAARTVRMRVSALEEAARKSTGVPTKREEERTVDYVTGERTSASVTGSLEGPALYAQVLSRAKELVAEDDRRNARRTEQERKATLDGRGGVPAGRAYACTSQATTAGPSLAAAVDPMWEECLQEGLREAARRYQGRKVEAARRSTPLAGFTTVPDYAQGTSRSLPMTPIPTHGNATIRPDMERSSPVGAYYPTFQPYSAVQSSQVPVCQVTGPVTQGHYGGYVNTSGLYSSSAPVLSSRRPYLAPPVPRATSLYPPPTQSVPLPATTAPYGVGTVPSGLGTGYSTGYWQGVPPNAVGTVHGYAPAPVNTTGRSLLTGGIPTELRNAVQLIVPFYSDSASCERAASFWRSFENCTSGMNDALRLTAFEQCLKGKQGQEWWYNSRIETFETLRIRFHNRFISRTPAQLWTQLRTARRQHGESVEEWGDRVDRMCEALRYNEPRMRYEFFLEGIRNKQLRSMLNSSIVTTIAEACALLLFKGLHRPTEEADEFTEVKAKSDNETTTQGELLQQMQQMNLLLMQQQRQERSQSPPSMSRPPIQYTVNAVGDYGSSPRRNVTGTDDKTLNIRMSPDSRTQQGETVCGRCERRGCSRLTCALLRGHAIVVMNWVITRWSVTYLLEARIVGTVTVGMCGPWSREY